MSVNQLLDRFKGVHQQAVGVTSDVLLQRETKLKVNQGKVVEEFPYFVFRYVAKKTPPKGQDLFHVWHSFTSYSLLHFDITFG